MFFIENAEIKVRSGLYFDEIEKMGMVWILLY